MCYGTVADMFIFGVGVIHFNQQTSGVARASPGGRVAHPESQNEEENEKSLSKNKKKIIKIWEKSEESGTLAHPGLCPGWASRPPGKPK